MELHKAQSKYKRKHKHCRFCKFNKYVSKYYIGISYHECEVKDKIINPNRIRAVFCKYYNIEEIDYE